MQLSQRDASIVRAIAKFQQLTAAQLFVLCFNDVASRTPLNRALKRLVASEMLARVELRRLVGGRQGGAGQYVYQLGRRGFQLFNDGTYKRSRQVKYHQLLLADAFLAVAAMQHQQALTINYAATGDDAAHIFGDIEIRPDMRLVLAKPDGSPSYIWLEVDMATEGRKQIQDKLARTWQGMRMTDPDEYPAAPVAVWLACDEERAKELRYIIDSGKDDGRRKYFKVCTLETLSEAIG